MKQWSFLFLSLVLSFTCFAQSRGIQKTLEVTQPNSAGKQLALIIGNNAYQDWPVLQTAVQDAEALSKLLVSKYGFNSQDVLLLRNTSRIQLLEGFDWLQSNAGPEDRVLIYYAGHGEYDDQEDGWWVPVDASTKNRYEHIANSVILNKLRSVKAHHKLLISDSCFSGNLLSRGIVKQPGQGWSAPPWFREKSRLKAVQGFTSGGNEPVSDGGAKWEGHSIFAYHLLAQLQANQRPFLAASELGERLKSLVANDTMMLKGAAQTPQFQAINNQGHQGGEFFFMRSGLPIVSMRVAYVAGEDQEFEKQLKSSRQQLLEALAQSARTTLRIQTPEVRAFDSVDEFRDWVKEIPSQDRILTITSSGRLEQKGNMMWQGLAYLKVNAAVFHMKDGKRSIEKTLSIPEDRLPLRQWKTSPEFVQGAYSKAVAKVSSNLDKLGVDTFFWEWLGELE
jgi:hypothetical protein